MNQRASRSERRLLQPDGQACTSPDRAGIARLNDLGLVACKQQDFVEGIIACDFVDQRIKERPAANVQHRLRYGLCSLSKPSAESTDQNDGLSQHWASWMRETTERNSAGAIIVLCCGGNHGFSS
jgi:hypothetical protein